MIKKPDKILHIHIDIFNYLVIRYLYNHILMAHFSKIHHNILHGSIDVNWAEVDAPPNIIMRHGQKIYNFLAK